MYMSKKQREKRVHITLTLPVSTKFKVQQFSDALGVSVSHFIEGLIEGVQIIPGGINETN